MLKGCPGHGGFLPPSSGPAVRAFADDSRDTSQGYSAPVAFATDGNTQFHLATTDLGVGFRTNQVVNPLDRGHIAFRTDDIGKLSKSNSRKRTSPIPTMASGR